MASVLETLEGLDGPVIPKTSIVDPTKTATFRFAEKVFKLMDNDRDGEITVDEFIQGYQKLKARQNSSSVTVTAFVEERKVNKNEKPQPAIMLKSPQIKKPKKQESVNEEENNKNGKNERRKSMKDVSKVKSLFGNRKKTPEIKENN